VSAPGSAINTDVYGPTVRGIRCLIVDDSEDAREMVAALLSTRGADVLTAESVDAALATLERQLPDVIVSDLSMPGRSGLDLIERVRSRPADQGGRIPAVALTAYAGPEDRRRSILAGFDVHLVKPVDAAELIETVTRLVRT
jgi:CheY-like chemotaxis protein